MEGTLAELPQSPHHAPAACQDGRGAPVPETPPAVARRGRALALTDRHTA